MDYDHFYYEEIGKVIGLNYNHEMDLYVGVEGVVMEVHEETFDVKFVSFYYIWYKRTTITDTRKKAQLLLEFRYLLNE